MNLKQSQRQVDRGNECFSLIAADAWRIEVVEGEIWFSHPDVGRHLGTTTDVVAYCEIIDGGRTT